MPQKTLLTRVSHLFQKNWGVEDTLQIAFNPCVNQSNEFHVIEVIRFKSYVSSHLGCVVRLSSSK